LKKVQIKDVAFRYKPVVSDDLKITTIKVRKREGASQEKGKLRNFVKKQTK
jgi:hypothetical protein